MNDVTEAVIVSVIVISFFKFILHLSAEFELAQADLLINMYAPVAGQVCEIYPWFDRAQPLLSTL